MIDIYGIPNCGSFKKALQWAREARVEFTAHNFKIEAPSADTVAKWTQTLGVKKIVNRSSSTWRTLDAEFRAQAETTEGATALLASYPLLIKRPLIVWADGTVTCGVDLDDWNRRIGAAE